MRNYEIWIEGYHVMEGHERAQKLGNSNGASFEEAVRYFMENNPLYREDFDANRMTYWGCRIFDNQSDARKSFG